MELKKGDRVLYVGKDSSEYKVNVGTFVKRIKSPRGESFVEILWDDGSQGPSREGDLKRFDLTKSKKILEELGIVFLGYFDKHVTERELLEEISRFFND